jgi:hypothetical protein
MKQTLMFFYRRLPMLVRPSAGNPALPHSWMQAILSEHCNHWRPDEL